MNIKSKTITLDNNEKYVVLDMIDYINRNFVILTKIINDGDNIDNQLYIAEIIGNQINFVNDQLLIDEVIRVFRER